MSARGWKLVAVLSVVASAVGCSQDEGRDPAPPAIPPTLSATSSVVVADGVASTTINVTSGTAPVTLSTTRGTFSGGGTSTTVAAVPGSAVLTPCNARVNPTCAGPAVVTAAGANGAGAQITVTFQGFEDCDNGVDDTADGLADCADPQCPLDSVCGANGLLCSATGQCTKCTGNGGAAEPSFEVTCSDAFDNDCDGAVDCADANCADATCTTGTGVPGVCKSGACVCDKTEPLGEATCGDGRDNDCDGVADCADPDCLGDVCDGARGLVCAGVAPLTCRVCPTGQTSELPSQCGDGKDNDCDGVADCYDADCQPTAGGAGQACNPFGGVCMLTSGVPSCGCPSGATSEASCTGGVDEDCDGLADCADDDCQPAASGAAGPACDALGRTCTSSGTCACPGGDVEICNNYDAAGNPIDDDCDGRANCVDRDCRPTAPGGTGEDCSTTDQFGMACDATGACACTGNGGTPEAAEVSCDDGLDNDCDYLVDCQDPSCATRECGPGGATCDGATFACVCPGGSTETSCSNGLDDNCDGKVDCEEPSCAAQACNPAFPTYTCRSGVCTDPATRYAVTITPARPRIPADGVATTAVSVVVTRDGSPVSGEDVALSLSDPTLGAIAPATVRTDSLGRATATFTSAGPVGVVVITGSLSNGASGTARVTMPAIGEIRLAEGGILYPVMGVKTSGFQEQNQLLIEILDAEQQPYPDGLEVTFEHRPLGGSTLSNPLAAPSCAVSPCVQSAGATEPGGLARVRLYSGTVAGVVRISATAAAGGMTRLFELPAIAIVGAKPNAGHFSVVCSPENVPAYAESTCHVSTVDAPFTCVALLKDRYNNVLGRSTTVSFMSEAGAVGPPAVTPDYDASQPADGQTELGYAVEFVNTLGAKLPKDVPANAGEVAITTAPDVCGVSQRSPRDGVVTVVAWTPGEEAFFDANGNGSYDVGEPFVDLPEPYVDYDDDDTRDGDEPFVDSDGDGGWDDVNGVWDTSANVWTKTVVVYTGMPARHAAGGLEYASRWLETADSGTYAAPTAEASFLVRPEFPPDPFYDCNENGFRDPGSVVEPFEDADNDGVYDLGERFKDCNSSGTRDSATEPYTDLSGNGVYDSVKVPATSETLVVAACDRNLNRLSAGTTYEVKKPETANFKIAYDGKPSLPDRTGFGFGFQPCLAATPASCALDCADLSTPTDVRCVMRTRVADFTYGYTAFVRFTGGSEGSRDGQTQAYWNVTLFGETLSVPVSGTHQ